MCFVGDVIYCLSLLLFAGDLAFAAVVRLVVGSWLLVVGCCCLLLIVGAVIVLRWCRCLLPMVGHVGVDCCCCNQQQATTASNRTDNSTPY